LLLVVGIIVGALTAARFPQNRDTAAVLPVFGAGVIVLAGTYRASRHLAIRDPACGYPSLLGEVQRRGSLGYVLLLVPIALSIFLGVFLDRVGVRSSYLYPLFPAVTVFVVLIWPHVILDLWRPKER
jgi:hypothetical protein